MTTLRTLVNASFGGDVGTSGTAVLDFGAFPGVTEASVTVSDGGVNTDSIITASLAGEATATHTVADHALAASLIGLVVGNIVEGVSFTIYASTPERLTGTFNVNWIRNS